MTQAAYDREMEEVETKLNRAQLRVIVERDLLKKARAKAVLLRIRADEAVRALLDSEK